VVARYYATVTSHHVQCDVIPSRTIYYNNPASGGEVTRLTNTVYRLQRESALGREGLSFSEVTSLIVM